MASHTNPLPQQWIDRRTGDWERVVERHQLAILLALTLVYFGATALRAWARPFWLDEILTLIAARQPNVAAVVRTARLYDAMPPLTHLAAHLMDITLGTGRVASRLPGMIGFWVFCLCLFRFTSRSVGPLFAFTAMLLPFATSSNGYSLEARCYGMLVGFAGVALVAWQSAAAGERRAWSLPVLALALSGVMASHYYAALIYLPLAGGELLRTLRRRRIDWPVWIAFAVGFVPFAMSLFTMRHVIRENAHPWAVANVRQFLGYYESQFQQALPFAVVALMLLAAYCIVRKPEAAPAPRRPSIPDYELLAVALFLALPAATIGAALLVPPHTFTERYAILGIAGMALLVPLLAARLSAGQPAVAAALAVAALVPFLGELAPVRRFTNPLAQEPILVRALANGPVVVDNGHLFLQLWYYAPEDLRPRIQYVANTALAARYLGTDTLDLNLGPLPRVLPIPVIADPGKDFRLYVTNSGGWLRRKVLDSGGTLDVLEWERDRVLLRARLH